MWKQAGRETYATVWNRAYAKKLIRNDHRWNAWREGCGALESSLKSTLGEEIKFQVGTEVQQTFSFDSPPCGYKLVNLYQRVRALHIEYDDQRFWHKEAMELTLLQWLRSIYDATVVEQHDPKCNCEKQYGPVDRAGVAVQFGFDGFAKLAVQREDNRQLKFPDFAESLNSYFSWDEDTFRGRLPTDILPEYLRFLAGIDSGLKVEAVAWREPVLFVTSPEFNHGASEVPIELDNSFEPIREPFGLYPIRVSMEGEVQVAEPERYQERGFF